MSKDESADKVDRTVTRLLHAWGQRDEHARAEALRVVYRELRRQAAAHLRRECPGHTLSPTDVVHETYLRPAQQHVLWQNRAQFFSVASHMMRRVLVDHARTRLALKRAALRVELTESVVAYAAVRHLDLLSLDEAPAAFSARQN